MMRLFFAIWPPEHVAKSLAEVAAVAARGFGGRPTRCETIHLTLAFLGDVEEERLPELLRLSNDIKTESFTLTLDRLGVWQHNRLMWAGSTQPSSHLTGLAEDLRIRLSQSFADYREKQAFAPHLTLVRKLPGARDINELPVLQPLSWLCEEFSLVVSRLKPSGSEYDTLHTFRLTRQDAAR